VCVDLHRHTEFSAFDGFGKALDNAKLAKAKGLTSLGIADHGTLGGCVEHWKACKEVGIIPILGVEAYFQPKYNKKNPVKDYFHLCLFSQNLEGYKNLNRIMSIANIEQKYGKPLVDFPLLEKYSEGVIATSGCIASFISQTIWNGKLSIAEKAIKKFISIFGDNFYIEIQPYPISEKGIQEKVNVQLIKYAKKYNLKIVLASDSHYGAEEDFDTYCKMHEMKGSGDFNDTYTERYMPDKNDLFERFVDMHEDDFGANTNKIVKKIKNDMKELESKVDPDILGKLPLELPKFSKDSVTLIKNNVKKGLKEKRIHTKEYLKRAKQELDVILHHGFEDYFLIVQDYVNFAKRNYHLVDEETAKFWRKFIKDRNHNPSPIKVGPGRGSVCNSLAAFALNITEVDSLYFDIDFTRFLRMDKKKLPDIDLDFETDRRQEVIDYIIYRYEGKAAQICSFGFYKVDNLLNDLFKVCGPTDDKDEQKRIKEFAKKNVIDDVIEYSKISHTQECRMYDRQYDNIMKHFSKMYNKLKYIGTHAAGVAIVGGDLLDYTSIESRGGKVDKETNIRHGDMRTTAFDLNNLEMINAIKFDMLGLRTLSITKELEEMTNECFSYEWLENEKVYEYFQEGKTDGIFQFEKGTAKGILRDIQADSFDDIIAASSLNRPGPLQLRMPEQYAHGKLEGVKGNKLWGKYTDKTYGTIVYQEQVTTICREIGLMSNDEADSLLKVMKTVYHGQDDRKSQIEKLRKIFLDGAKKSVNLSKQEANELYEKLIVYTFNQGHATGYSLISLEQMYFKVKYPELFWFVTLKYAQNDSDLFRLKVEAVKEGNIILIPHVNYGAKYEIITIEGERALAEGLSNVKNVGLTAANAIENERKANGKFKNKEDFISRVPKRQVNAKVIRALEEAGSLVFDKDVYFERVQKWNSHLYMMGGR
jgi:DNA polymerase-3 subunit alpha